jgi:hypothetical protein
MVVGESALVFEQVDDVYGGRLASVLDITLEGNTEDGTLLPRRGMERSLRASATRSRT